MARPLSRVHVPASHQLCVVRPGHSLAKDTCRATCPRIPSRRSFPAAGMLRCKLGRSVPASFSAAAMLAPDVPSLDFAGRRLHRIGQGGRPPQHVREGRKAGESRSSCKQVVAGHARLPVCSPLMSESQVSPSMQLSLQAAHLWHLPPAAGWQPWWTLLNSTEVMACRGRSARLRGVPLSAVRSLAGAVTTPGPGLRQRRWVATRRHDLPSHHATVIPSRITPFSSDHGRQTGLGQISTTLGDHAGISGAVAFLLLTE